MFGGGIVHDVAGRLLSSRGGESMVQGGAAVAGQALATVTDKLSLLKSAESTLGADLTAELTRKLQEVPDTVRAAERSLDDDFDVMKFLIILVFAEHVIVIFKAFLEEWIPDAPPVVVKKADKCET